MADCLHWTLTWDVLKLCPYGRKDAAYAHWILTWDVLKQQVVYKKGRRHGHWILTWDVLKRNSKRKRLSAKPLNINMRCIETNINFPK